MSSLFSEVEVDPAEYLANADDDILKQLSDELEIPMLMDDLNPSNFHLLDEGLEPYSFMPNFDSHFGRAIKQEPLSPELSPPSPHGSESSGDSWPTVGLDPKAEWKGLETPPITPPHSSLDGSPPSTPTQDSSSDASHVSNLLTSISSPVSIILASGALTLPNGTSSLNNVPTTGVKIQPKPIVAAAYPKTQSPIQPKQAPSKVAHPLVLSPEEFAKLTSQGLLRFKPPVVAPTTQHSTPITYSNSVTSPPPLVQMQSTTHSTPITSMSRMRPDGDFKAIKRQQRMIKNRESACLSRKKKKEYVTNLEGQIKDLARENVHLQLENGQLKQRLSQMEKEVEELRKRFRLSGLKKTSMLLAVVFMISLNVGPLSVIFSSNTARLDTLHNGITAHHGRSLLWTDSVSEKNESDFNSEALNPDELQMANAGVGQMHNSSKHKSSCPLFINKTESQRLESELRGWVFRSEKEAKRTKNRTKQNKLLPPIPRMRSFVGNGLHLQKEGYSEIYSSNELQLYNFPSKTYDDLLEAIKRRDDTFYVVSFTGDHLLLPALAHNKTRRPLMSLVLPAIIPLNETMEPPKDYIAMMQIDCEVTNTKLVHVKESLVRHHVQEKRTNQTTFFPSSVPSPRTDAESPTFKNDSTMNHNRSRRKILKGRATRQLLDKDKQG